MDKYEASVWRVPNPTTANVGLVKRIQKGKATATDLAVGGATQLGVASDDYAPCADSGQNCANDIYAVSLPQVTPSSRLTWFQAQIACENAAKRLPSNAEWQGAVVGTPDAGPDDGVMDCNTSSTFAVALTGSRNKCVSARGAFDMVGNLYEWTADWVPGSGACGSWSAGLTTDPDDQCIAGALSSGGPAALLRGGQFDYGGASGPLAIFGVEASAATVAFGFRCAR